MTPAIALVNCDLYTPDLCLPAGVVVVAEGVLTALGPSAEVPLPPDARLLDAEGGRITPGLIDLTRFGAGAHPRPGRSTTASPATPGRRASRRTRIWLGWPARWFI